jgi:hypothetical protein
MLASQINSALTLCVTWARTSTAAATLTAIVAAPHHCCNFPAGLIHGWVDFIVSMGFGGVHGMPAILPSS